MLLFEISRFNLLLLKLYSLICYTLELYGLKCNFPYNFHCFGYCGHVKKKKKCSLYHFCSQQPWERELWDEWNTSSSSYCSWSCTIFCIPAKRCIPAEISRNGPKWVGIVLNFFQDGKRGLLVPVCIMVREITIETEQY